MSREVDEDEVPLSKLLLDEDDIPLAKLSKDNSKTGQSSIETRLDKLTMHILRLFQ